MTINSIPTIYDVARKAGVSTATVSRVVNNRPFIRHNTLSRVRAAIGELRYAPDPFAQSMALMRVQGVGMRRATPRSRGKDVENDFKAIQTSVCSRSDSRETRKIGNKSELRQTKTSII